MLTCDRWYRMCQTVQKSADKKRMLTIIYGTKCLSTQHFLFVNFCGICHMSALGVQKCNFNLIHNCLSFFTMKCAGLLKITVDKARLYCYR